MKLLRFRVTEFRSIEDSGWIDAETVTALIGTNESGKTNLLLPLWKLNPAKDGAIVATSDYPRKKYGEIRNMNIKPVFIRAEFDLSEELKLQIAGLTGEPAENYSIVEVFRRYGENFEFSFPKETLPDKVKSEDLIPHFEKTKKEIESANTDDVEGDEELKNKAIQVLSGIINKYKDVDEINATGLKEIDLLIKNVSSEDNKESIILPIYKKVWKKLEPYIQKLLVKSATHNETVSKLVKSSIPSFVYYSNYGNLDSEIYLPHVIENMKRKDLGAKEAAKARTLKVLFDFVKLSPKEILDLGEEVEENDGEKPTQKEIQEIADQKKERDILLQSASSSLTQKFRDWWKQGEYKFRLAADGKHFRIWVSDEKRPEDIELEGRSTGLQWFLSFYLIFLVESSEAHNESILLLDEPGLSLHPLAQKDLAVFFENLSQTNQLIFTTHSPFLVDSNHMDRVKAVFVNESGYTCVSSDLKAGAKTAQAKSIYPVYAALGLTVSDTLLQGCQTVIVEGISDQYYLTAIKNYLIAKGLIHPIKDIVFIPSGGVKGISSVVSIVTGQNEELPYVILDADKPGKDLQKHLQAGIYINDKNRVICVDTFNTTVSGCEIEDLIPIEIIASVTDKIIKGVEENFSDEAKVGSPVIDQIEVFAKKYGINLEDGWKVELAKSFKTRIQKNQTLMDTYKDALNNWQKLFETVLK